MAIVFDLEDFGVDEAELLSLENDGAAPEAAAAAAPSPKIRSPRAAAAGGKSPSSKSPKAQSPKKVQSPKMSIQEAVEEMENDIEDFGCFGMPEELLAQEDEEDMF